MEGLFSILSLFRNDFNKFNNTGARIYHMVLKGTATLMMTLFYMKDLNKPCILIPVSSKSVEKRRSCGHLNICKWTVKEAAIL